MDFQTPLPVCVYMVDLLPPGVVSVLEPTPGKGNIVKSLKGYQVTTPKNFFECTGWFDAVVMNPPFTPMALGYKILYATMEMTDTIICLMPWLTIINSEKRSNAIKAYGLKSITHLPRWVFPGSRVQTCILEMQRGHQGETLFHFYPS